MIDILVGAAAEATEVCQVLIRQAALNTILVYEERRWFTRDLSPIIQRTRNQMNNLLFAVRNLVRTQPERLYQDQSVLLSLCETNNLIGWQSGQIVFSLRLMQFIAEGQTQAQGQYIAFFTRLQRLFDMQFQTRIALSLFFHAAGPSN